MLCTSTFFRQTMVFEWRDKQEFGEWRLLFPFHFLSCDEKRCYLRGSFVTIQHFRFVFPEDAMELFVMWPRRQSPLICLPPLCREKLLFFGWISCRRPDYHAHAQCRWVDHCLGFFHPKAILLPWRIAPFPWAVYMYACSSAIDSQEHNQSSSIGIGSLVSIWLSCRMLVTSHKCVDVITGRLIF